MTPFWVHGDPNGCRIERHVPVLPLSRDVLQFARLRRSLALYRMVEMAFIYVLVLTIISLALMQAQKMQFSVISSLEIRGSVLSFVTALATNSMVTGSG